MKFKVAELVWDAETYARQKTKTSTIEAYVASLEAGAVYRHHSTGDGRG